MRIAFLLHTFPGIGGTETVTLSLINWFLDQHIECHIIAWHKGDIGENPSGIDIMYLPDIKNIDSPENFDMINSYAITHHIDIVINQGPFWLGKSMMPRGISFKIISVLHYAPKFRIANSVHNIYTLFHKHSHSLVYKLKTTIRYVFCDWFARRDFNRIDKPIFKNILDNSDAFVLLCSEYCNEMANLLSLQNKDKLYAISNPAAVGILQVLRGGEILSQSQKDKTLLYVGRLTAWDKRVDRLLRIWSKIQSKYQDWQLQILGDGEERDNLESLADTLHLERISFRGFCDPTDYYRHASILCSTSNSEGFPMIFCEAAAYGVCAITYNVSAGVEYVINNLGNGMLVSPCKEHEYIQKLCSLMDDVMKRQHLADEGVKNLNNFNIENIGSQWIELFNKVLSV